MNFTVAGWFNPNASIATKALVVKNNEIRLVTDASGNPGCQTHNGTDWQTWATSTTALATDTWAHVACTYDGQNLRVYVNGSRTASEGYTGDVQNTTNVWRFGSDSASAYGDYNGRMDEVRIYNRALQPREVRDLYEWAPGPIAHWKMDEKVSGDSQTIYNHAATSTNGLLDGTTVDGANDTGMDCTVRGKYGGACEFDGVDDYVDTTNGNSVKGLAQVTVCLWFKTDVLDGSLDVLYEESVNAGSAQTRFAIRIETDNKLSLSGRAPDTDSLTTWVASNTTLSTDTWYHLCGVFNSADDVHHLYINGVDDSNSVAEPAFDNTNPNVVPKIGRYPNSNSFNFNGIIDEVRIYDYARTQKQIIEDMNAGHPSGGSPVGSQMGYWKFDEGFGSTAFDSSSQDNDGTYTGNASSTPAAGRINRGMALDGTGDYVSVSDSAGISFAQADLSWGGWVNPTSLSADTAVLAKQNEYRITSNTSGNLGCQIHNGTDWQSAATSTTALSTSAWKHVSCTYDGTTLRIYIDGQEEATQALSSMSNDTSNALRIGSDAGGFGDFNGSLDEVKIYNYTLSVDEVYKEYNQGKTAVWGALSTDSDGITPSWSASREYCIPGDTSTCRAPIGEWHFNEKATSTAYDTSKNSNDGTLGTDTGGDSAEPTWVRGKIGSALDFDGDADYIDVGAGDSLDFPGEMSAFIWAKFDDVISSTDPFGQCGTGGNAGQYNIGVGYTDNEITTYWGNTAIDVSTSNFQTGIWYHIGFTRSGSTGDWTSRIYVNGVLDEELTSIATNPGTKINFNSIGRCGGYDGGYFDGLIDQVRLYDYARTAAQIAWEYNRGAPVGHWKLDECQGSTIYDSSGNGNHGTASTTAALGSNTSLGTCTSGNSAHQWYNGVTGKRNYSLDFDGNDDYVEVSDASAISFATSTISLSAWVNPGTVSGDDAILAKNNEYRIIVDTNGLVGCQLHNGSDWQSAATSTTALQTSTWNHVGCTYDTATLKVFINTKEEASQSITYARNDTSNALRIADDTSGTFTNFDGQIDEVKIWNYALTGEQIKMEYNQGAVNFGPDTGAP